LTIIRQEVPAWEARELLQQWINFAADKGVPQNPMGALRQFARKKQQKKP
jgi:hypothetical protein